VAETFDPIEQKGLAASGGNAARAAWPVRSSRDEDVDAMVAIYLHHIQVGVDATGSYGFDAPELTDLRQRRKNMQKHRLPHLVADRDGRVNAPHPTTRKRP
jgi:hypothetical protein